MRFLVTLPSGREVMLSSVDRLPPGCAVVDLWTNAGDAADASEEDAAD
ncbi:hypothetical protein [Bradyrhizobium liaoningense]|nr:hypothetical protein [Bradyrhizobium liaoningense]MBR0712704.1 hypothetical protein [Bradyrhizobium liaoningense]